mgnify:FL=1
MILLQMQRWLAHIKKGICMMKKGKIFVVTCGFLALCVGAVSLLTKAIVTSKD